MACENRGINWQGFNCLGFYSVIIWSRADHNPIETSTNLIPTASLSLPFFLLLSSSPPSNPPAKGKWDHTLAWIRQLPKTYRPLSEERRTSIHPASSYHCFLGLHFRKHTVAYFWEPTPLNWNSRLFGK